MDAETIKVECLKLAAEKMPHPDASAIVKAAEILWQWVTSSQGPSQPPPSDTAGKS